MSLSPSRFQQLLVIFDDLREDRATEQQIAALCDAVVHDQEARQLYLQHAFFVSALRWNFSGARSVSQAVGSLTRQNSEPIAQAPSIRFIPRTWLGRISPRFVAMAASILVAGYFLTAMGLVIWERFDPAFARRRAERNQDSGTVSLVATHDCQWEKGFGNQVGTELGPRVLKLQSGIAEFRFASGAKVLLQGPAEFEAINSKQGYLREGRLAASVPEGVIGFRVDTPTASVIDLGTEFEVLAEADQATVLQVRKGRVQITPIGPKPGSSELSTTPMILSTGEACRVAPVANGKPALIKSIDYDKSIDLLASTPLTDEHEVVADYRRDFQSFLALPRAKRGTDSFPSHWKFFWNSECALGDVARYSPLVWDEENRRFRPNVPASNDRARFPSKGGARFAALFVNGGHPGGGVLQDKSKESRDHYVIACVPVREAGEYAIASSSIECKFKPAADERYSPGVQLIVMLNNSASPKKSVVVQPDHPPIAFDMSLGALKVGDQIWIAVGPRGSDSNDTFDWGFQIVRLKTPVDLQPTNDVGN